MSDDTTGAFPRLPEVLPDVLPEAWLEKLKLKIPGYRLLHEIGRGGQAVVYKAIREATSRPVAVKVLHGGVFADGGARERLRREMTVLAALEDQKVNIVQVIDFGTTPDGNEYLVMNYIPGRPLDKFLLAQGNGGVPLADAAARLRLFVKIAAGVAAAHRAGIVHRDLSPSNILVDDAGEPHILDFGLARTAFDRFIGGNPAQLSVSGTFLGKVAYASPEQAAGKSESVDLRSDVYALGVILYQILTDGEFPYEVVGSIADVLSNIVNAKPTPPSKRLAARAAAAGRQRPRPRKRTPSTIHPGIEAIVLKALEKAPADRYQSAGEMQRDVENYLAGKPTVAQMGRDNSTTAKGLSTAWIAVAAAALVLTLVWTAQVWNPRRVAARQDGTRAEAAVPAETAAGSGRGTTAPAAKDTSHATPRAFDIDRVRGMLDIAEMEKSPLKQLELADEALRAVEPHVGGLATSDVESWKLVARLAILDRNPSLANLSAQVLRHHLSDPRADSLVRRLETTGPSGGTSIQLFDSAQKGSASAMRELGRRYESLSADVGGRNDAKARGWYEKAAAKGDAFSQTQLGVMCSEGRGGLPRSDTDAVAWYQKGADAQDPRAMRLLGHAYLFGEGKSKDEGQAKDWFQRAADAGDAVAMGWLGKMLESGGGKNAPDPAKALDWFHKSANSGNLEAKDLLTTRGQ